MSSAAELLLGKERAIMQFAYEGFTHRGDNRYFRFRCMPGRDTVDLYSIEIKLALFLKYAVPIQDGPMLCLQMLEAASGAQPCDLERFHRYCAVNEDFQPRVIEREKIQAEKALKNAARKPFRKPSHKSNIFLGVPSVER